MRPIWSGTISFVLVNIPVRLYTAVEQRSINFNLLHEPDNSRIRYSRICEKENKEVDYNELVRGYEYKKDQYVIITNEDLEKADPKRSKAIEIINFVDEESIDNIYYAHPYYLEPEEGAEKSFSLLGEALGKSKKVAIAKFVLKEREYLAVLKSFNGGILLQQLRFSHEIRSTEDLKIIKEKSNANELELALALIDKLSDEFRPQEYKDDYYDILKRIIDQRAKGELVKPFSTEPTPTEFEDLMAKLKESLEKEPIRK